MAAIPGFAFFIIGIAMTAYAKFVESKTENTLMTIFFYIGILFLVIGVIKMFMDGGALAAKKRKKHPEHHRKIAARKEAKRMHKLTKKVNKKEEEARHEEMVRRATQHHRPTQHPQTRHPSTHHAHQYDIHKTHMPTHPSVVVCPRCGTKMR